MQKKFITNLAFILSLNLLIKPFWILGIDRAVQNATGAESYGMYYTLFSVSLLFNILLDLGITNFNNQNISRHQHLVHKHFSGIVFLRIMLTILYFIISLIFAITVGYRSAEVQMLLLLLFNQALLSFILYLRSNIAGLHYFRTDSIVSVTDRFLMIVITGALLIFWKEDFRIEWFVYAQTSGYVLTALFTLWILHGKITLQKLYWNPMFLLLILKKSLPFAVLILLMTFYNRVDTIMLERLLPGNGAIQVGIYAQAYRLLDSVNMVAFLFAGLLLPMFSHLLKKKESVEELTKLSFSLIAVPSILLAVGCITYRNELMELMYNNHVAESAQIFGIIICCFIAISSNYIFGTLLTANGNLKQLNIMACCGMILNVGMNFIMIPRYYALGAAISGAVTQFGMAIIQVVLSHKILRFKLDTRLMFLFVIFLALVLGFNYLLSHYVQNWFAGFVFAGICGLIAAFSLRLINIPTIFRILKQEE